MTPNLLRWRGLLWWVVPFAALALLLGIETDWGRAIRRLPGPAPTIEPKPVVAALLLSAGSLTDRIGARRAYATGVAVFVVASAACGLAPNLAILVAGRPRRPSPIRRAAVCKRASSS